MPGLKRRKVKRNRPERNPDKVYYNRKSGLAAFSVIAIVISNVVRDLMRYTSQV